MSALSLSTWVGHSLAAGGAVFLLAAVLCLIVRSPARRRITVVAATAAALLVPIAAAIPSWWHVPLPATQSPSLTILPANSDGGPAGPAASPDSAGAAIAFWVSADPSAVAESPVLASRQEAPKETQTVASSEAGAAPVHGLTWPALAAGLYGAGVLIMLVRWGCGHVGLWRLRRRSLAAPAWLVDLLDVTTESRRIRVLVSKDIAAPVCFGLIRPTILIPNRLVKARHTEALQWILAHEAAHLQSGDGWMRSCLEVAQAFYFPIPWFHWLKRRLELSQEYLADAAAARLAARVEDYAEFLVSLARTSIGARQPRWNAAPGVLGRSSDLSRRVDMLLKSDRTMEAACPRRWPLFAGGGFLAIAIILAGVGFQQAAPADDSKPDETKKSDPKTDPMKTPPTPKPAKPKAADQPPVPIGPFPIPLDGDPEQLGKNIQKMMEEMMKRMQDRGLPGAMIMPFPGGGNDPFAFRRGSGRLGVTIEKPSDVLVEQLDLPRDQGLVVREVSTDSAAAKAGIKANDILLELAGKNVSSDPQEFRKQVGELKSKTAVDAVVLRKGKKETVKGISLPDATANDDAFGGFPFPKIPNMPNIPNLPAPPPLPPPPLVQNFGGKSTSIQIQNDTFTIQSNDEELSISVSGKFDDGKTTVNSVVIRDGNDKVQCDSLEAVPEKYRDQVQKLLKSVQKK